MCQRRLKGFVISEGLCALVILSTSISCFFTILQQISAGNENDRAYQAWLIAEELKYEDFTSNSKTFYRKEFKIITRTEPINQEMHQRTIRIFFKDTLLVSKSSLQHESSIKNKSLYNR